MGTTASFSIPGFIPHVVASNSDRSVFSIVWSCVATLFACAWVAVHPDVPGLDDEKFDHFFHRLKLLVWVLISPEAVLIWAWRQHRGAQALRYMFNEEREGKPASSKHWNTRHGHFLQMGGFVICPNKDEKEQQRERSDNKEDHMFIATPVQLRDLSERGIINFPKDIKSRDIDDRSKSDGLAYFVAIGQLLWFVTQCIARTVAGLSITLFELVAVSFAPITIIMYILWWSKPQNAQAPIVIKANPDQELPVSEPHGPKEKLLPFPISYIQRAIQTFEDMLGTTHRSQSIPPGSRSLPWFYAYPHEHDSSKIPETPLIAGSILGTIFGVIHILGWNFQFASTTEKRLWRASAVVIIIAPLLVVLNVFSARKRLHPKPKRSEVQEAGLRDSAYSEAGNKAETEAENKAEDKTAERPTFRDGLRRAWYGCVATLLALGYIAARVILLGVMCSSLRKLPSRQLRDVDWITDIPHIF